MSRSSESTRENRRVQLDLTPTEQADFDLLQQLLDTSTARAAAVAAFRTLIPLIEAIQAGESVFVGKDRETASKLLVVGIPKKARPSL